MVLRHSNGIILTGTGDVRLKERQDLWNGYVGGLIGKLELWEENKKLSLNQREVEMEVGKGESLYGYREEPKYKRIWRRDPGGHFN